MSLCVLCDLVVTVLFSILYCFNQNNVYYTNLFSYYNNLFLYGNKAFLYNKKPFSYFQYKKHGFKLINKKKITYLPDNKVVFTAHFPTLVCS